MTTEHANNLLAFRQFIDEQLADGASALSLDDALVLWELEHQTDAERQETLAAIQRGLDDMYAGRTVDAFEFTERMRNKLAAHTKP